jgi:hypothetical protein
MGNFLLNFKWEYVILHVILSVPNAVYNVIDFSVDIKALTISSYGEPGSSDSIVSGYGLEDRVIVVRSPAEAKGFFL